MSTVLHKTCSRVIGFFKKCFNKKEFFTLMIVPHTPLKNIKSVKFPKWIVSSFIIVNAAMFSVVCVFGISYYTLNKNLDAKKTEYQVLQSIKEDEEKKLNEYKANENEIKERIETLKGLQTKLKGIIQSKGGSPQSSGSTPLILASRGTGFELPPDLEEPEIEFESLEEMYITVDELAEDVDITVQELEAVIKDAEERMLAQRAIPSVFPVSGHITSLFGYRRNPFGRGYEFHPAIDIANSKGTPIKASGDGVVVHAGWDSGGYGQLVTINHGNGYVSMYGHNSKIAVKVGQTVERGQIIAYMGSTGRSTGSHCHFEVRYNGKQINPYNIKEQ